MPQARQDPATYQQDRQLRAAFVLGPVRSRRDDHRAIVGSELLVGALQFRLVAIGARDTDFGVIRNEDCRGGAVVLQRPHMAGEPVRQRLGTGAFGVRQAARPQCAHEQLCLEGFLTVRSVDRNRAPGVTGGAGPNTRCSSSLSERLSASAAPIPHPRTARRYFETAPTDSPSARASARTLKLLACSPISCFSFDMETLSFGIDLAPQD